MQQSSPRWMCALDGDGISCWCAPTDRPTVFTAYTDPKSRAVVLGMLFPSLLSESNPRALRSLPPTFNWEALLEDGGQQLAHRYWGSYVALARDESREATLAFRDVSGRIPCHYTDAADVRTYFSHLNDATQFGCLPRLSLNRRFLSTYLYLNEPRISDSGFNEVHELLAGESIHTRRGTTRRFFPWDPRRLARDSTLEDYEQASRDLRGTAQKCIDALGAVESPVLLQLSGGFDSSVVLGLTKHSPSPINVTCLNRFLPSWGGDERQYARAAAERANVPLVERDWRASNVRFDDSLFDIPATTRPSVLMLGLRELQYLGSVARELGCDCIWSGEGGDHLFIQQQAVPYAADFAHRHGLKPRLWHLIQENANYAEQPWRTVFRDVLSLGLGRAHWDPPGLERGVATFINVDSVPNDAHDYARHPWYQDQSDLPVGQRLQIINFADLVNREAPPVILPAYQHHPLVQQPLMEASLKIPTYVHLAGGQRRGLAHHAFRDVLPQSIWMRKDKGGTAPMVVELFVDGVDFVRSTLLDGYLAKERLLVRSTLERILSHGRPFQPEHLFPLLACLVAEIWARKALRTIQAAETGAKNYNAPDTGAEASDLASLNRRQRAY